LCECGESVICREAYRLSARGPQASLGFDIAWLGKTGKP